jgi:hypothetical protein
MRFEFLCAFTFSVLLCEIDAHHASTRYASDLALLTDLIRLSRSLVSLMRDSAHSVLRVCPSGAGARARDGDGGNR